MSVDGARSTCNAQHRVKECSSRVPRSEKKMRGRKERKKDRCDSITASKMKIEALVDGCRQSPNLSAEKECEVEERRGKETKSVLDTGSTLHRPRHSLERLASQAIPLPRGNVERLEDGERRGRIGDKTRQIC
jgi:hypothetical protein